MKSLMVMLVLAGTWIAVMSDPEAKVRPFQAEQNFRLLKKTMETSSLKKVIPDNDLLEGSGDDDDYDYDEDDYEDEDYYDDLEESSGFGITDDDDEDLTGVDEIQGVTKKVIPDHDQDFHFVDNNAVKKTDYEDLLYEYYNDLEEDEDDDDYLKELEQDLSEAEIITIQKTDSIDTSSAEHNFASKFLQPSYIFLMLSSALISFALFSLAFICCRRKLSHRQKKMASTVPFVTVSSRDFTIKTAGTPIVKDYQRVPTSTKEMIQQSRHQTSLEMGLETQRPLLT